jgi:prepilin-type N-terminal cleavage/methylation domain-containing protein
MKNQDITESRRDLITTKPNPPRSIGFTIIEMLISLALLGIILSLVFQYFSSANAATESNINQSDLQDELRVASEIISDEVQRALYVFPPCGTYSGDVAVAPTTAACDSFANPTAVSLTKLNVTWGSFLISKSKRFLRPNGVLGSTTNADYRRVIGDTTAPVLAMIVPPRDTTASCGAPGTEKTGCYAFVAYFVVKRSTVTAADSATPRDFLNPDPSNDDRWVVMEYRKNFDANMIFNTGYLTKTIKGLGSLASSGTATDSSGKLTITGSLISEVSVPSINWVDAGCTTDCTVSMAGTKLNQPSTDPNPVFQAVEGSIPAIQKTTGDPPVLAAFAARMTEIVRWLEDDANPGTPKILVDYIQPNTGFAVDFARSGAVDLRGATEVRLRLQGSIRRGSKEYVFPGQPIEVFATPRNIAPVN